MVKLASGREVELRPLTFKEKMPIKDYFYTNNGVAPIFSVAVTCLLQIGFVEEKLKDWTDAEILEAGNWVFEESGLSEKQKKS